MSLPSTELNRLRWQCRRGLLENDLILDRFMERHGSELVGRRLELFRDLLELGDNELWDILSGRVKFAADADPIAKELIGMLRMC